MDSIGTTIKNLRVDAGMSQSELAEALGKTRSAISQYEADKIIPRMSVIEQIAKIFHVAPLDIMSHYRPTTSIAANQLTGPERHLVKYYRLLTPPLQQSTLELLRLMAAEKNTDERGP